jgi:integrase
MYAPFLSRLITAAGQRNWRDDSELLITVLRQWEPNTRSRQEAHDRFRRLWREAGWSWPEEVASMRGNGKAKVAPGGVRAFTDAELDELRARIQRSVRLGPADLVAWDLLACFGLRPAEIQGIELEEIDGAPQARVVRVKRSGRGFCGPRLVAAVPPAGWPADCYDLVRRWQNHGLPAAMVAAVSPGEVFAQQLRRLRMQKPVRIGIDAELTSYGCRHAFALRLAQQVGLHVREAAELMGHSPATHLRVYGRRLDQPALLQKVRDRVAMNQNL